MPLLEDENIPAVIDAHAILDASGNWATLEDLIGKLHIRSATDTRFLQLKLQQLERENRLLVEIREGKKSWKTPTGPYQTIEDTPREIGILPPPIEVQTQDDPKIRKKRAKQERKQRRKKLKREKKQRRKKLKEERRELRSKIRGVKHQIVRSNIAVRGFMRSNKYQKGSYKKLQQTQIWRKAKQEVLEYWRLKGFPMTCDYCRRPITTSPTLHHKVYNWHALFDPKYIAFLHYKCHARLHRKNP